MTADLFAANGWQVYVADLVAPPAGPGRTPLALDVTSTESCERAAAEIAQQCDGLDAVINFAGVLEVGLLVEVPEERMRRVMDVNLLGTYRVNKAMFDLVRRGRGRIVNISSEAGRSPAAMCGGPYAISKHAVEAYSDSLRRELMFLDIPVVVVQPGSFKTNMTGAIGERFAAARLPGSPFADLLDKVGKQAAAEDLKARDPQILARAVYKAATTAKPKRRYAVRHSASTEVMCRLPAGVIDRLLKAALS